MKNSKKFFSLLLTAIMAASCIAMTACGDKGNGSGSNSGVDSTGSDVFRPTRIPLWWTVRQSSASRRTSKARA